MSQIKRRKQDPLLSGPYSLHSSASLSSSVDCMPHKMTNFNIPITLYDNEYSFIEWFKYLKQSVPRSDYKYLLYLEYVDTNNEEYYAHSKSFTSNCLQNCKSNNEICHIFLDSIDPWLIDSLLLSNYTLAFCILEKIKCHFQAKIDIFYLLKQEEGLSFDPLNKLKILHDLDYISNIYELLFGSLPTVDMKVNWILNSLGKDSLRNQSLLLEIQLNWQTVSRDIGQLRNIIIKS